MMKLLITPALTFIAFTSIAQYQVSYEAFYSVDDLSGSEYLSNSSSVRMLIDYSVPNYTFGVNAKWSKDEKLFLISGINYSRQEIVKSFDCPACGIVGDIQPLRESQRYAQIPLGVSYRVINKKIRPDIEVGIFNNVLVAANTNDILGNDTPRGYYLSGYVGAKVHYRVYDFIGLNIGYKRMNSLTSPFESDFTFRSNNYSIGVTFIPGQIGN